MIPFQYTKADTPENAINGYNQNANTQYLAGGTNLVDLIRRDVAKPEYLIDISNLPIGKIEMNEGALRLGAMVSNSDTADNDQVKKNYPLVSEAILLGATDQLRNKATNGGNLMQRTRCPYFMNTSFPCNKREPGSGCPAKNGHNRILAILGTSEKCIATYPSDMSVALAALDAVVQITAMDGNMRSLPITEFHRLPGDTPQIDNNLKPGELIIGIVLPESNKKFAANSHYLKVRDRHSYAFALVSVAVAVEMDGNIIKDARLAMGGVAAKPWRDKEVEKILVGKSASVELFREVGERLMSGAKGYGENDFKIELGKRAVVKALKKVTSTT